MLKRFCTLAVGACLMLGASASPAFADLTAFLGFSPTPEHRLVRGLAVGSGLVVVGFEFEYADTADDEETGAPALTCCCRRRFRSAASSPTSRSVAVSIANASM
jgi:hypothetical protein